MRRHFVRIIADGRCGGSCLKSYHFGKPRWADHEVKKSRPSWPTWRNPISTKNTNIGWVWWHEPVVPATWEAEAEESFEPGRQRLQWAKIKPLHSRLDNRVRLCLQKKKKNGFYIFIRLKKFLTNNISWREIHMKFKFQCPQRFTRS